jgi:hypothetical protein
MIAIAKFVIVVFLQRKEDFCVVRQFSIPFDGQNQQ